MLGYKYRDGNTKIVEGNDLSTFERDLKSIEKNYFWAPSFENLNDPCETRTVYENVINSIESFGNLLGNSKLKNNLINLKGAAEKVYGVQQKFVGIYALSKTWKDEILWAHYSNSHYGFCIEYDLDLIENEYKNYKLNRIDVNYINSPPQIEFQDFNKKYDEQILKIAGYKSKRWEYEEEVRLVTGINGIYPYPPQSLKSIYFGLRMDTRERKIIMNRLRGRGIKYYEIIQIPNSYKFDRKEIRDPNEGEITYLKQVKDDESDKIYKFQIINQDYNRAFKKGTINIELKEKVPAHILEKIGTEIKENLFFFAENIFMFYKTKNQKDKEISWATSHFRDNRILIKINKFVE